MSYINWWSVLNALLLGTLFILIFHLMLCREKYSFSGNTRSYAILLMLIFIRIFTPIDIASAMVIPSTKVYVTINDVLNLSLFGKMNITTIIISIWIVGFLISLINWIRQIRINNVNIRLIQNMACKFPEKYKDIALSAGIAPERILFSKYIDEVITIGAFNYYVLVPMMDYSREDISNILRHETEHIHHKDILIKIIFHIASSLLWWNPLILLFEHDYSLLSEYRCDDTVVKNYSDSKKINYVETLKKMAVIKNKFFYKYSVAGFAIAHQKSALISRANRIINNDSYNKKSGILVIIGIILFLSSYMIQIQPSYDMKHIDNEVVISSDNAYIKYINNEYVLYIDNEAIENLEKSDLKYEPYIGLEIRK